MLVGLVFFGLAGSVLAVDQQIAECCQLKNKVKIGNDEYDAGKTIGSLDVSADNCPTFSTNTVKRSDWGMVCLLNTVYTVSNWIFYLVILLSTIMIVFGGFTYITSSGDPTKSAKGKSIITYALIGLAVALLAKVLPSVMKFFLGL